MIIEQKIGTLAKVSNTQVQLAGLSIVKLGGQFKSLTSPTLLTSVSGIGGIDTGAIAASSFYYVYAVSTGSVEGLVASLSATSPVGFLRFKKVGAFYTDSVSAIFKAYRTSEINILNYTAICSSAGAVSFQSFGFITANTTSVAPNYTYPFLANLFSLTPSVVATLFGINSNTINISVLTSSTVQTSIFTKVNSVDSSQAHHIVVSKVGIDAIQPDWKDY